MPSDSIPSNSINKLARQTARQKRKALNPLQQHLAAKKIAQKVCATQAFKQAKNIALYSAFDGEINPALIQATALKRNKACYLPKINKQTRKLRFYRSAHVSKFKKGSFGIFESSIGKELDVSSFDLVIMPLAAFDNEGNRLGMGGGYYDYNFRFLNKKLFPRIYLLGIAHRCQQAEKIETQNWDIKPHRIIAV